jgi:hypothetical protein
MSSIVFANTFDAKNISISTPKVLDSGAKQAYVNYNGGKLVIQSPSNITLPYGVSASDKSKFGGTGIDYSIDISLKDGDVDGSTMHDYTQMLKAFDDAILEEAYKNRMAWFRANHSKETIRAFYKSSIKISLDAQGNPKPYPPTHKVKLQKNKEGAFVAKFFDSRGKQIKDNLSIEEIIPKRSQVTILVECGTVWFAAGSTFGVTWKVSQVLVQKAPERGLSGFGFQGVPLDEGGDEEEAEHGSSASAAAPELVDDEEALGGSVAAVSAVAAVMPKAKAPAPAPAPSPAPVKQENPFESVEVPDGDEHEAENVEPVPAPVKKAVTTTKIVKKVVKKA